MAETIAFEDFDQARMLLSLKYVTDCCDFLLQNEGDLLKFCYAFTSTSVNKIAMKFIRLAREMNTIHNRHVSSIGRLPLEIMGLIFKNFTPIPDILCADDAEPTLMDGVTAWCKANLVCRSWRAAALSTVSAWSTIFVTPSKNHRDYWNPFMLTWRCFRSAPTTAICDIKGLKELPAVDALIGPYSAHLQRFRARFRGSLSHNAQIGTLSLSSLWGSNLQVLILQHHPDSSRSFPPAEMTPSMLSKSQSLQVLVLRGFMVFTSELAAPLPPTLRVLCLSVRPFRDHEIFKQFFAAIVSLVALEELEISCISSRFGSYVPYSPVGDGDGLSQSPDGVIVPMPSTLSSPLKRLVIRDETANYDHDRCIDSGLELLARIHVPDACPLIFHAGGSNTWLSPVVKSRFAQAERVYMGTNRMMAVRGTSACCAKRGSHDLNFPCPGVRELWIADYVSTNLQKTYQCFANVDKLVVVVRNYDDLVDWLAVKSAFPTLKRIQILEEDSDTPTDALFSLLKARKDSGNSIQSPRFFRRPDPSRSNSMDAVRQRYEEICVTWRGVVDSLSYKIVDQLPRMKIPLACARPADGYSVWNAKVWDTNEPYYVKHFDQD